MTYQKAIPSLAALLLFSLAPAGEFYDVPGDKQPCDICPEYAGSVSIGYNTDYLFRGLKLADENWYGDVNYTFKTCVADIKLGAETIRALSDAFPLGEFERNNYYVSVRKAVYGFDLGLTYAYRDNLDQFGPDDFNDTMDLGLAITKCFMGGCATLEAIYDFGGDNPFISEGWYHQLRWDRVIEVNDKITVLFTTGLGYYDQQFDAAGLGIPLYGTRGFSHRFTTVAVPFKINCRMSLIPYLTYVDTMEGGPAHRNHTIAPGVLRGSFDSVGSGAFRNSFDDGVYGGVSAKVEF